jgi:diaminopimelate epimerase
MTLFYKLSGCGNDFIALAEPAAPPFATEIRAWCRRGVSLGADGLFALYRIGSGEQAGETPETKADGIVEMRYWNSDGGEAALCLNGTRCAARLAFHLGWHRGRVTVRTGAGDLAARDLGPDAVAAEAPRPRAAHALTLRTADGAFDGFLVDVGVPHFVCFRDTSVDEVPIERWAPPLRSHHDLGPDGANVDFVRLESRDRLSIRSFERGVEAETLACGTGVLAAAAAALAAGRAALPLRALTRGRFTLEVMGGGGAARGDRWQLAGDARLVAQGTLFPAAGESADGRCETDAATR